MKIVLDKQSVEDYTNGMENMPDMTDEEYDALDEYWTVNTPKLSGNGKSGFFAKHTGHVVFIDSLSADWLRIKAAVNQTTPDVIIGELIRAEISKSTKPILSHF